MNIVKVLIIKELIIIKNSLLSYLVPILLFPLLLYLFFSIPLSVVFNDMKPIYMIWSSGGIWMVSSLILIYFLIHAYSLRNYKSEFMKSTPVLSYQYMFASYLLAIFFGILQLIVSIIITISMNSDYMILLNILKVIVVAIPAIIVMCSIGFIVSIIVSNEFLVYMIHISTFLGLSFGFGSFIPLAKYPMWYVNIMKYFPVSNSIYNIQRIVSNEPILFSLFFISIFYTILFSIINYFIIEKSILNNN